MAKLSPEPHKEGPKLEVGLKGLVVAETELSFINGDLGHLIYKGYTIEDLADNATFEEVSYLFFKGKLPNREELAAFTKEIAFENDIPYHILMLLKAYPKDANPMAALRTAVSALSCIDPDIDTNTEEARLNSALRILAKMPILVAAFNRMREGKDPISPRKDLTFAQSFLYCLTGQLPTEASIRAMDLYLVLLLDHGLNASTFAALVTAGTKSDFYSCMISGICTLKGPLHGGANRAAMEMIEKVSSPEEARQFVRDSIAKKERIMGFGHRVYNTKDPRGASLEKAAKKLLLEAGEENLWNICKAIEEEVHELKGLDYNVDFYSAPVLKTLGIPTDTFVTIFAISRLVGWAAHVIEYMRNPALIRPRFKYNGPKDLKWVPIDER